MERFTALHLQGDHRTISYPAEQSWCNRGKKKKKRDKLIQKFFKGIREQFNFLPFFCDLRLSSRTVNGSVLPKIAIQIATKKKKGNSDARHKEVVVQSNMSTGMWAAGFEAQEGTTYSQKTVGMKQLWSLYHQYKEGEKRRLHLILHLNDFNNTAILKRY